MSYLKDAQPNPVVATHPLPLPEAPLRIQRQVQWGDTDAAGIVYTARYMDYLLESIEAWYRARLDTNWYQLNIDQQIGTPFVNVTLDFLRPVTPRTDLEIEVRITRAGSTSVSFEATGREAKSQEPYFKGRATSVFMDNATGQKAPIPVRFRAVLEREAGFSSAN